MPHDARHDLVATTRALVERAADAREALALARHELEEAAFRCTILDEDGVLWARRGRTPRIALAGHVDVVPVGDEDAWHHDPRGGELHDGRVHGRGACDMLGAVATFLVLAEHHPHLDLAIALTTDEETGMEGAATLADSGLLRDLDACVLGEPTDLRLGLAHKGGHWSTITTRGRNAHASMPQEGDNAIAHLATVVQRLHELDLEGNHPLLSPTTVVPTVVQGGTAWNQVPDRAELKVDTRFPPPLTPEEVTARFEAALSDVPTQLEVGLAFPPFHTDPGNRLPQLAGEALEDLRRDPTPLGLPYGTEASRYQRPDLDLIVLGPGEAELAHTPDESVPVANLEHALEVYQRIVEAYQPEED